MRGWKREGGRRWGRKENEREQWGLVVRFDKKRTRTEREREREQESESEDENERARARMRD